MALNHVELLKRLSVPENDTIDIVIDTDAYNEVDDQVAIVYALGSPERLNVKAIYAAPFFCPYAPHYNLRSTSPADGMAKSYDEIIRLLDLVGRRDVPVLKGSNTFLESTSHPLESEAITDLIERAMSAERDLYVVAIGAITNIASALLLEPRIRDKIVILWLGGNAVYWRDAAEFNLSQDIGAARTVFDSGAPLVHIPCKPVASHLVTNIDQLTESIAGRTEIGTFLTSEFRDFMQERSMISKVVWDVVPIAYLVNSSWVPTAIISSPILSLEAKWSIDDERHPIRVASWVERDPILSDLFSKINRF